MLYLVLIYHIYSIDYNLYKKINNLNCRVQKQMIQLSGSRITFNDSELPKRRITSPEARGIIEKISLVAKQLLRCLAATILSFVALVAVPFSYTVSYFRSSKELSNLVSQQRQAEVSAVSSSITSAALQELKLSMKAPSQEQLKSKVSQLVQGMKERSASDQLKKRHTQRVFLRTLARHGILLDTQTSDFSKYKEVLLHNNAVKMEIAEGPRKLQEKEIHEFKHLLTLLVHCCCTSKDGEAKNHQVVDLLRKLQSCEAYQVMKTDSMDPAIAFIHTVVVSLFSEPRVMDSMQKLGEGFLKTSQVDPGRSLEGVELSLQLKTTQQKVAKHLYENDSSMGALVYGCTHVDQTLAALSGEGTNLASFIAGRAYDTRLGVNVANNASAQSDLLTAHSSGVQSTIRTIYGGSPTNGPYIQAEFLLLLQAIENNQFNQSPSKKLPHALTYTNLQSLGKHGEAVRSQSIMQLNEDFPLSFRGMTLPKDTDFYASSKSDTFFFSKDKTQRWVGTETFGKEFKGSLLEGAFILGKRDVRSQGAYFPGSKEEWIPVIEAAVTRANTHFNSVDSGPVIDRLMREVSVKELESFLGDKHGAEMIHSHLNSGLVLDTSQQQSLELVREAIKNRVLRCAYQEYVYTLLEMYLEQKYSQTLSKVGIQSPYVLSMRACKENIDRGGSENAKFIYLELGNEYSKSIRNELISGALYGRALSVRDRVVLKHRITHFLHLVSMVSPSDFKKSQHKFLKQVGVGIDSVRLMPLAEKSENSLIGRVSPQSDEELASWTRIIKTPRNMSLKKIKKAYQLVQDKEYLNKELKKEFFKSLKVQLAFTLQKNAMVLKN